MGHTGGLSTPTPTGESIGPTPNSMLLRSLGRTKNGEKCWTCAPLGEGRSLGMDTGALFGRAVGFGLGRKIVAVGFPFFGPRDL